MTNHNPHKALELAHKATIEKSRNNVNKNLAVDEILKLYGGIDKFKAYYNSPLLCINYQAIKLHLIANGFKTANGSTEWTNEQVNRLGKFIMKYR